MPTEPRPMFRPIRSVTRCSVTRCSVALTLTLGMAACADSTLPSAPRDPSRLAGSPSAKKDAAPYTFELITPCTGCLAGLSGISNNGIVGVAANGQGYLYDSKTGTFTAVPGTFTMTVPADNGTAPGVMLGAGGFPAPVIRYKDGTVHQIAAYPGALYSAIIQLNNNGFGVGWAGEDLGYTFSFLRSPDGVYTRLEYPGPAGPYTGGTILLGMTESGTLVGYLRDPAFTQLIGVIRHKDGTWEQFMVPGATATMIYAINESGTIVGGYQDATGWHGFVWARGTLQTIDVPGAPNTFVSGINNRGDLVVGTFAGPMPLTGTAGPAYLAKR